MYSARSKEDSYVVPSDRKIAATAELLLALGSGVSAGEIKVLTNGILKGSFTQIAAQFEHEAGHES